MKPNPLIKLSEIPEEGHSYVWNSQTGEINQVLEDLIKNQNYQADFSIRPINSKDYQLIGKIVTKAPELCSKCGFDILFPVKASFHEILIPPQPDDRSGKYAKVNHVSEINEDGPGSTEYGPNLTFDAGEFLHEVVALCLPLNPSPAKDAQGNCFDCGKPVADEPFIYDEIIEPEQKQSPFEALKTLKLQ